jgi:hypothetical protein
MDESTGHETESESKREGLEPRVRVLAEVKSKSEGSELRVRLKA